MVRCRKRYGVSVIFCVKRGPCAAKQYQSLFLYYQGSFSHENENRNSHSFALRTKSSRSKSTYLIPRETSMPQTKCVLIMHTSLVDLRKVRTVPHRRQTKNKNCTLVEGSFQDVAKLEICWTFVRVLAMREKSFILQFMDHLPSNSIRICVALGGSASTKASAYFHTLEFFPLLKRPWKVANTNRCRNFKFDSHVKSSDLLKGS